LRTAPRAATTGVLRNALFRTGEPDARSSCPDRHRRHGRSHRSCPLLAQDAPKPATIAVDGAPPVPMAVVDATRPYGIPHRRFPRLESATRAC
jgi:hypothetical protein